MTFQSNKGVVKSRSQRPPPALFPPWVNFIGAAQANPQSPFPGIDEQRYGIPLKPQWEAEETYNFNRYHVPGCDQETCDGACGQENKKALREEIKLRRDAIRERKQNASESTTDGKEEPKTPPPLGKTEEPGDEAFVMGGKGKGKAKEEDGPPKSQKKVKFAS
ncbi:MAG: hypothetical protein Q9196_004113 [Gyalolechia fulgens]